MTYDNIRLLRDYAQSVRGELGLAEEGAKKDAARRYLSIAEIADRNSSEVDWAFAIDRAARALKGAS